MAPPPMTRCDMPDDTSRARLAGSQRFHEEGWDQAERAISPPPPRFE
jgi:hypothetical protein